MTCAVLSAAWSIIYTLLRNAPTCCLRISRLAHRQQIGQSTEELLEMMETMLLWSKEQMDHFQPDIKRVPVLAAIRSSSEILWAAVVEQAGQVQIRFADPAKLEVSADENYLKVIMQNLCSNAIKALRDNPNGLIEWKAWKEGQTVCLSITDNNNT